MLPPSTRASRPAALAAFVVLAAALPGCITEPAGDDAVPEAGPGPVDRATPTDEDAAPVLRGHVHDYWEGGTVKTLLDDLVPLTLVHNHLLDEPPREQHMHGCDESLESTSQGGSVRFSLPIGSIVPPGTASLEVTVTWDVALVTGLRLYYRPPVHDHADDDPGHSHLDDGYMEAGSFDSGGTALIPVTLDMTDLGHDIQSRWAFFLCADDDDGLGVGQGDARVTMLAHRMEGDLPLDAPHPDHWWRGDRIPVARLDWSGEAVSALNKGDEAWQRLRFLEHAIVPPLTSRLVVHAWLNGTGALDGFDGTTLLLYHKDATVPDWVYEWTEPRDGPAGSLRFEIPLGDREMADSTYAESTQWELWLRIVSPTYVETPFGLGTLAPANHFEGTLQAHAVVFRE